MTMQSAHAWNNRGVLAFCHSVKGNSSSSPLSPDAWIRALQELQTCPVPPPSVAQRGHPHHGLDLCFDSPARAAQNNNNNTFFVNAMVQIRRTKRHPDGNESYYPLACHQMTTGVVMFNLALSYHVSYLQSRNMEDYAKACRIYEIATECLLLDAGSAPLDPWAFVVGIAALYNGAVLAQEDGNTASFDDSMETILEWIQDWNCIICMDENNKMLHGLVSEIHTNALLASCALFPGSLCTAPAA